MHSHEINNKSNLNEQVRDILKKDRRKVVAGYPRPAPIATIQEVREYLNQDAIDCLICGRRLQSLAAHLSRIHHISSDEYRKMYGLPFRAGLCSAGMTQKLKDAHASESPAKKAARRARIMSPEIIAMRINASRHQRTSRFKTLTALLGSEIAPPCPRKLIRGDAVAVLEALERGEMLYPYLKRVKTMSATAFKVLLREYPDLYERYRMIAGKARRIALYGNKHAIGQ